MQGELGNVVSFAWPQFQEGQGSLFGGDLATSTTHYTTTAEVYQNLNSQKPSSI